ncbi:MAG TPA: hypothetical protein VNN17_12205, partial [Terriglobia bacterium]|nr:hypothetical protein [Terriglobia bacterium]
MPRRQPPSPAAPKRTARRAPPRPLAATERRSPAGRKLDAADTLSLLRLIQRQDARVPAAVARQIP